MKRLWILVIILVFVQVCAATDLSGPLSGILGPGSYNITGAISIQESATLRIMPGTTIWFAVNMPFNIDGILLAEGTATDSIIFSGEGVLNTGGWGGLNFSGSCASGSILSYCRISRSATSGVRCNSSSPSFSNCAINGNTIAIGHNGIDLLGGGVYCNNNSSPAFLNCTINDNALYWGEYDYPMDRTFGGGVYCINNSSPSFSNCKINSNSSYAGNPYVSLGRWVV